MQKRLVSEWHTVSHALDHAEPPWDWLFRVVIPGHPGLRLHESSGETNRSKRRREYQHSEGVG